MSKVSEVFSLLSKSEDLNGDFNKVIKDLDNSTIEHLQQTLQTLVQISQNKLASNGDKKRFAKVERDTKETKITVELNLDGKGTQIDVETGIGNSKNLVTLL